MHRSVQINVLQMTHMYSYQGCIGQCCAEQHQGMWHAGVVQHLRMQIVQLVAGTYLTHNCYRLFIALDNLLAYHS